MARPLEHDQRGSITLGEKSGTTDDVYIYDAWNRLVRVERHFEIFGNVAIRPLAELEYNGRNWQVVSRWQLAPLDATLDKQRARLYGFDWQLLEEHIDDDFASSVGTARWAQQFWGAGVDATIARRLTTELTSGEPDWDDQDATAWFILRDAQNNPVAILDTETPAAMGGDGSLPLAARVRELVVVARRVAVTLSTCRAGLGSGHKRHSGEVTGASGCPAWAEEGSFAPPLSELSRGRIYATVGVKVAA